MLYEIIIAGIRPIIQHSGAGLDPRHPWNTEKAQLTVKRGSNRTESDDRPDRPTRNSGSVSGSTVSNVLPSRRLRSVPASKLAPAIAQARTGATFGKV